MKFELFQALAASATLFVLASATPFRIAGSTTANNVVERNLLKRDILQTAVNDFTSHFDGENVGSNVRYFANIGFEISVCIDGRIYGIPWEEPIRLLQQSRPLFPGLRFKFY